MPVTLTVDGQEVTVPNGATILDAARKAGTYIPYFVLRYLFSNPTVRVACAW